MRLVLLLRCFHYIEEHFEHLECLKLNIYIFGKALSPAYHNNEYKAPYIRHILMSLGLDYLCIFFQELNYFGIKFDSDISHNYL